MQKQIASYLTSPSPVILISYRKEPINTGLFSSIKAATRPKTVLNSIILWRLMRNRGFPFDYNKGNFDYSRLVIAAEFCSNKLTKT